MIKRILVALSGTPFTTTAVRHAVELANVHEAEITGVTLIDIDRLEDVGPVPIGGGAAAHALAEHRVHITEERIADEVERFQATCQEASVVHRVVRESGHALEELSQLWRYHDLTVIGLRGLFEYGVLANPHDQIVKLLARGLRPIIAVATEHQTVDRVVIAYNGSMESSKAMKRFVQMRLWSSCELEIVCFDDGRRDAKKLLADAAAYCRAHGFESTTHALKGRAAPQLLEFAHGRNADLIVMGSTGRGKLAKFVLGDTADTAIRQSDIPLFLAQ